MSDDETTVAPTEQAPEQITAWSDCQQDDELDGDRHTWWMLSGYVAVMALLVVMLAVVLFIVTHSQRGSAPITNQLAAPPISITSTVLVTPPPLPPSPVTSTVTATPTSVATPAPTTTEPPRRATFTAAEDQQVVNSLRSYSMTSSLDPTRAIYYAHEYCRLVTADTPTDQATNEVQTASGWDRSTALMVTASASEFYNNCFGYKR